MNLAGLILLVLLWGFFHSALASLKAKAIARRLFGSLVDRFYRLAYNLFAGLSFIPILWLLFTLPDRILYILPFPWSLFALIGEVLAAGLLVAGFLQTGPLEFIGLRQLISPASGQSGKLVKSGLYHYVRHPLYTAGLVLLWLFPTMGVNLLSVIIALTIYIVIGATFEEQKLQQEYGEAYVAYQASTPMLVPFLHWNKK